MYAWRVRTDPDSTYTVRMLVWARRRAQERFRWHRSTDGRAREPNSPVTATGDGERSGNYAGTCRELRGNPAKTLGKRDPPIPAENQIPSQRPIDRQELRECDSTRLGPVRDRTPQIPAQLDVRTQERERCYALETGQSCRLLGLKLDNLVVFWSEKAHRALSASKTLGLCVSGMLGTIGKLAVRSAKNPKSHPYPSQLGRI